METSEVVIATREYWFGTVRVLKRVVDEDVFFILQTRSAVSDTIRRERVFHIMKDAVKYYNFITESNYTHFD